MGLTRVSFLAIVFMVASHVLSSTTAFAQASSSQTITAPSSATPVEDSSQEGAMTSAEILALFQREARAAYQMNKQACDGLTAQEKKICLARARLQFDADMRYAQKRADQGY